MSSPDLISSDPIVARNFFLQLGDLQLVLHSVEGFDIEVAVVEINQNGPKGSQQHVKTLGGRLQAPKIVMGRMAPVKAASDPLWEWFQSIRQGGMKATERMALRKHGSIHLLDSAMQPVGQFDFFNGWPSSIKTSGVSTDSSEAMKETITIECERIERIV